MVKVLCIARGLHLPGSLLKLFPGLPRWCSGEESAFGEGNGNLLHRNLDIHTDIDDTDTDKYKGKARGIYT